MRATALSFGVLLAVAGLSALAGNSTATCVEVLGGYCTVGAETRAECANGDGTGAFVAVRGTWMEVVCLRDSLAMAQVPTPSQEPGELLQLQQGTQGVVFQGPLSEHGWLPVRAATGVPGPLFKSCLDVASVSCVLGVDTSCNPDTTLIPLTVLGQGGCGGPDALLLLPCAPDPLGEYQALACVIVDCRWGGGVGLEAGVYGSGYGEVVCVRLVD